MVQPLSPAFLHESSGLRKGCFSKSQKSKMVPVLEWPVKFSSAVEKDLLTA